MKIKDFNEQVENSISNFSERVKNIAEKQTEGQIIERETIKQEIKNISSGMQTLATNTVQNAKKADEDGYLPSYLKNDPEEIRLKVRNLIEKAFNSGLEKAIEDSKKENPFIEDAFHDALVDKLIPILKNKGIIK